MDLVRKRSLDRYIIIVTVALVLLVAAMMQLHFLGDSQLEKHAYKELEKTVRQNTELVNEKLHGNEYVLEGYADYLSGEENLDFSSDQTVALLLAIVKSSPMYYASLVGTDGVGITSLSMSIDISDRRYFQHTLTTGEHSFEYISQNYLDGRPLFLLSVPVKKDGVVVAVLTGGHSSDSFDSLLGNSEFDGYTNEIICTKDGEILSVADRAVFTDNAKSIFELAEYDKSNNVSSASIRADMAEGTVNTVKLKRDGVDIFVSYVPIDIYGESYYMFCSADGKAVKENFSFITDISVIFVVEVVVITLLAILLIMREIVAKERVLEDERDYFSQAEERYRLVENLSDSVMFEVDPIADTIRFNTRYDKVFGHQPITDKYSDIFKQGNAVHVDDIEKLINLKQRAEEGMDEVAVEVRLLGEGNDYYWTKLIMVALRGADGRVTKIIGKLENIDKTRRHIDQLKTLAEKDSLTDLYNHDALRVKTAEYLSVEAGGEHAFIMADLDGLKHINDTYGHAVGDKVIIEFANQIKKNFRATDIIGRLGGDEFAIFAKNIKSRATLEEKAKCISAGLSKSKELMNIGEAFSASVGIAFSPEHGVTFDTLYKNADKALYTAKNGGKAGYRVYQKGDGDDKD